MQHTTPNSPNQEKKLTCTAEHYLFLSGLIHQLENEFCWQDGAREMRALRDVLSRIQGEK